MRNYSTLHLNTNSSKETVCSKKGYECRWAWETIQHYTWTQIIEQEHIIVRKDMNVNKHVRGI